MFFCNFIVNNPSFNLVLSSMPSIFKKNLVDFSLFFIPFTLASNSKKLNFLVIDLIKFCFTGYIVFIIKVSWTRFFVILELLFKNFSFSIQRIWHIFRTKMIVNCLISDFICSHLIWSSFMPFWSRMLKDYDIWFLHL